MEVIEACRNAAFQVSLPFRPRNMAFSDPIKETKMETSVPMQSHHQHMIRDPRSTSESHNTKPLWFFHASRALQTAAKRKINALYKQSPGLDWEEKWTVTQVALRKSRPEDMAAIDEAILHMKRFTVFEGDSPLPDLFANCSTEQERLDVLLARPSASAQVALDTFSRRTVSGNSMTSACDTEEAAVEILGASKVRGEDIKRSPSPTKDLRVKKHVAEKEDVECISEEDDECMSEDDEIMKRLWESCKAGCGGR